MASSSGADPWGLTSFLAEHCHNEERHHRMALGFSSPSQLPDDLQGIESLLDIQLLMMSSPHPPGSIDDYRGTQGTRSTVTKSIAPSRGFSDASDHETCFSDPPSVIDPIAYGPPHGPVDQSPDEEPLVLFCEFVGLGQCDASFRGHDLWPWVEHVIEEHLRGRLPESCRCWFCDDVEFKASQTNGDRRGNFCQRMEHIHRHIVEGHCTVDQMRPDFDILRHLYWNKLVDKTVYRWARQYEEGPTAPGTYAFDFIPPEQREANRRGQRLEVRETPEERRARRRGHQSAPRRDGPSSRRR